MPKKKPQSKSKSSTENVIGLHAEVLEQPITDTLENNYMPYAMSVIVSRAIPEIDGFKPSHRKLLYTMYKMNLLHGARTKSSNIVGQTMKLNPHGDGPIYETMVRLSYGYEALLAPFIDSKGNFGKVYSRDMAYAAPRYTEAKLAGICSELFHDIDQDTVDFVDNYDGTTKEPALLPTKFPNILVSSNTGIAVGMASQICGFNLTEVCETTIAYMDNTDHDLFTTLPAPDFPTGGEIIYDRKELESIYETGRGSFKVRARWRYDKKENLIEIYEIPYSTTIEAIMDKTAELIKAGKIREIADMRDETDLGGLKITIDLKRGIDPEKLMQKLYKMTSLCDSYSCNFNVLIAGYPHVLGIRAILDEWIAWRVLCVKRRIFYDLSRKKEKLHLLNGLKKILLDMDRAIAIIRETEKEADVVPNLMQGFGIDALQAEYVAEIRLRNINREYILKRVDETSNLEADIAQLEATLESKTKLRTIIKNELRQIVKKYPAPRRTGLVPIEEISTYQEEDDVETYPVHLFLSREGYFKKITPQSLRMSGEQKYKENDGPQKELMGKNHEELLVFTTKQQVYKLRLREMEDSKASLLGVYLPSYLEMDEGETVIDVVHPGAYTDTLLLFFENGRVARINMSVYATKTNRKRLTGAFSDKSPLVKIQTLTEDLEFAIFASDSRAMVFHSTLLAPKSSRTTQGVAVMSLKTKAKVLTAMPLSETKITNLSRYRVKHIPAAGALLRPEDRGEEQLTLM